MERITIDKNIMHGKPVVKGTRVPVEIVVGSLAGGMSYAEIEAEYGIGLEDILACLDYVTQIISMEQAFPLPALARA